MTRDRRRLHQSPEYVLPPLIAASVVIALIIWALVELWRPHS